MNDLERIFKTESLEKQLASLNRLREKKREKLLKLRTECGHKIVVCMERINAYDVVKKCLFCGEKGESRHSFFLNECIDVSRDENLQYLPNEKVFEIVKKLYLKATMEHPEFNSFRLAKVEEEQIENTTPEFVKLLGDAWKKD